MGDCRLGVSREGKSAFLPVAGNHLVKAGENRGVRLTHDHVVRAVYGPYPVDADGDVSTTVAVTPPTERGRSSALVAFVQDTKTGDVLQTLTLAECR